MCEDEKLKYSTVIKTLGNFEKSKTVSKNASRKGQAFSSAIKAASLSVGTEIKEIDDYLVGQYNFSDGCGLIRQDLLDEIVQKNFNQSTCSAIQIRMGGYKGMLMGFDG